MNIAYVHTGKFPSNTPSLSFSLFNAVGLAGPAEQVHFFVKKNTRRPPAEILAREFDLKPPINLHIYALPAFFNTSFFYFWQVYFKLRALHRAGQLDAVISRSTTFLPFLARLKAHLNLPVYYEAHDFFADLTLRDDLHPGRKQKQARLEQQYIDKLSGVFCLQQAQKELYAHVFPNQHFWVARTGIHKLDSVDFEARRYIVYVGSLEAHKGLDVLLDALRQTATTTPVLIIGGKDAIEINQCRQQIAARGLADRVTVTGWIDKNRLDEYLRRGLLGIVPLRPTFFNKYLTSPLKIFDYYAYGIPMLAADLPTTRELIVDGQTGLFFAPENSADLAAKIDRLLIDPPALERMSRAVYTKANEFLWTARAETVLDCIRATS